MSLKIRLSVRENTFKFVTTKNKITKYYTCQREFHDMLPRARNLMIQSQSEIVVTMYFDFLDSICPSFLLSISFVSKDMKLQNTIKKIITK